MKNRRKLTASLQITQTECGLCCVKSILNYYGRDVSTSELRQVAEPGRDGLGSENIRELLAYYGVESNTYRVKNIKAFSIIDYPVIAFWKGFHFVCVELFNGKSAVIMDPSVGKMVVDAEEFKNNFSNIIISAVPGSNFEKKKVTIFEKINFKYLMPPKLTSLYIKLLLISLVMMGINVALPFFTQVLIDKGSDDISIFQYFFWSILGLMIITTATVYSRALLSIKMSKRFSKYLIGSAFERILELPAKYFSVRTPGEIVYRMNSLTRIQDLLGVSIIQLLLDCLSMLAIFIYVMVMSPILFLGEMLFVVTMFFVLLKFQPKIVSATDKELHEGANAQSTQLDAVVSINSVKLGGYKSKYLKDWAKKYDKALDATEQRLYVQQAIINTILMILQNFAPMIIFIIALFFRYKGILTFGQAVAMQSVSSLLFGYVNSVFSTISEFSLVTRYVDLADDIYRYPLEETGAEKVKKARGIISIENVSYRYDSNSPYAIRDVNLRVKQGETIAFVGKSGSGKTTLGKIICSLFKPTEGKIYFDGVDYSDYELNDLRSYIGYIPQEAYLHNRTIMENLSLGTSLSEEEIIEQCSKYSFMDFVRELPMGYNTFISEMGGNLSGGQRQRIFISKILLQKPKILVMDEATSSLDNLSQQAIYYELNKLKCTKFIIAHRLETVLNADRIVVVDNGAVIEIGTHNELMQNREGSYYKLFNTEYSTEEKYGRSC